MTNKAERDLEEFLSNNPDDYEEKTSPEYKEKLKRDEEQRRKLKDFGKY